MNDAKTPGATSEELFLIGTTPIRDLTDAQLENNRIKIAAEIPKIQQQLSQALENIQRYGGLINLIIYEQDRRAKSIRIVPPSALGHLRKV